MAIKCRKKRILIRRKDGSIVKRYVLEPILQPEMTTEELINTLVERSKSWSTREGGLTYDQVEEALNAVAHYIRETTKAGETVELPFGIFTPKRKVNITITPDGDVQTHPSDRFEVEYSPTKEMKQKLANTEIIITDEVDESDNIPITEDEARKLYGDIDCDDDDEDY